MQIPHYHLEKATEAVKPVMGEYYREPEPSPGWFPTHLIAPLVRSFGKDHYVEDEGNVVFYKVRLGQRRHPRMPPRRDVGHRADWRGGIRAMRTTLARRVPIGQRRAGAWQAIVAVCRARPRCHLPRLLRSAGGDSTVARSAGGD